MYPRPGVGGGNGEKLIRVCDRDIQVHGRLIRIARLDAEKYESLDDPVTLLEALKNSRSRIDLFTFMQIMPDTAPHFSYPMEWDNLAVLPVSTFEHWWNEQIRFRARNKARQGEKKGVILREVPFDDVLVRGIWEVYNECPVRQGRPFSHFGKDIETVRSEEATFLERSIFIGAFLDEKLIGFVKLVTDGSRTQAGLMNIVSMIKHRDKAPTNALVAQAVRVCSERGIPYLVYANFSYGKKQSDGVSEFKESNGFQRINLPRYYIPLTPLGHAALRLGLHHKFVDRLPEPVAAKLRELRNSWYNRKLHSVTEAS